MTMNVLHYREGQACTILGCASCLHSHDSEYLGLNQANQGGAVLVHFYLFQDSSFKICRSTTSQPAERDHYNIKLRLNNTAQ
jgi:hypothetical protein